MSQAINHRLANRLAHIVLLLFGGWPLLLGGCAPTPTSNVIGYLLAKQTGRLAPASAATGKGALHGMVVGEDGPLPGAAVMVAERTGEPHVAYSDDQGRYRIDAIPPGQYTPAAVAPGYAEFVATAGSPNVISFMILAAPKMLSSSPVVAQTANLLFSGT